MKGLRYVVLTIAGLFIAWMILGDAFWHPNSYLLMDGGDGYIIYFNAFFHVNHGGGTSLTSMNYPDPECIFMTDAQGVLAIVMQWMSNWIPSLKDYVVGAFHSLIIIGIVSQLFIVTKVLERFSIQPWMAVIGAVLIGSLAPQLVRISYGHFGLAYPFLIPLAVLFVLTQVSDQRNWIFSLLSIFTFLVFGFNNPYLLVIISILILSYGFLELAFANDNRKEGFTKMTIAISMMAILYVVMAVLDPFDDRVQQQWGHFYFSSTISGILSGTHSLQYDLLFDNLKDWEFRGETLATISLASIIGITSSLVFYITARVKGISSNILKNSQLKYLLIAALMIFLYSSAMFRDKHWQMLISEFDFITMVKASGRLSWVPYYILSITGFIGLNALLKSSNFKYLGYGIILLWSYEGYRYLDDHCSTTLYPNHLTSDYLVDYLQPISSEVDLSNHQALYTIPVSQSWNDNLLTDKGWITEQHAYKLASASGIPLINSRLSRAPVGRSLENIQLSSHPLIEKTLFRKLDPTKFILLAQSQDYKELTFGEESLLAQANIIYSDDDVILHQLNPIDGLFDSQRDSILYLCNDTWDHHESFSHLNNQSGFIDEGGTVNENWAELTSVTIPDSIPLQQYEISVWSKVNIEAHGMPFYNVKVIDATGQQIIDEYIDSRRSTDTQDGWLRTSYNFDAQGGYHITLRGFGRYEMCIDEVLIRNTDSNICQSTVSGKIMVNNY